MRENNAKASLSGFVISGLIVVAIWSRVFPHPSNMTALVPAALLAGYFLSGIWLAPLVPLAALAVSDALFFSFYPGIEYVYGAALLAMLIGRLLTKKQSGFLLLGGLAASICFFVVSNLGVWLSTSLYPRTWDGLVQCYVMAVPFFRHQIIGDVIYGVVLYVAIRLALSFVAKKHEAQARS